MTDAVYLAYNPNNVKAGWVAFWLVVALGVATFLLWRSMNSQLRKIQMPPKDRGQSADNDDEADQADVRDSGRDTLETPETPTGQAPGSSRRDDDPVG